MHEPGRPLAYFLTWTTYGTWLPGDARGSIDDEHNRFGEPPLDPQPAREAALRARLAEPPYRMSEPARKMVEDAIREHATFREWTILALSVRSNHVQLVIEAPSHTPEQVMAQCKSWATRRLRSKGTLDQRTRVWTKMGSTRSLWTRDAVLRTADYTSRFQ